MKKNLLVAFSSGETSAYMAHWVKENKSNEYNIVVAMANTGEENEESLLFAEKCNNYFGLDMVLVEAVVHHGKRKACTHKVVDFNSYSRNGEPFEEVIKKYGIPNQVFLHCTRELKTNPIKSYAKSLRWDNYYKAIGIRADEIDRMSSKRKEMRYIYPLIEWNPKTKPEINEFWNKMPFRLEKEDGTTLKGWDDNCKVCYKKSLRKLLAIAKESPEKFDNFKKWELKYERHVPPGRKNNDGNPIRFYRGQLSVDDILEMSKKPFEMPKDDRVILPNYSETEINGHDLDKMGDCIGTCEPFK
jgi:hypothetical protein